MGVRTRECVTNVSDHIGTLASVTARLVPFTGVLNFRDLGGYETEDGRSHAVGSALS
jgi:hypothetical protein